MIAMAHSDFAISTTGRQTVLPPSGHYGRLVFLSVFFVWRGKGQEPPELSGREGLEVAGVDGLSLVPPAISASTRRDASAKKTVLTRSQEPWVASWEFSKMRIKRREEEHNS